MSDFVNLHAQPLFLSPLSSIFPLPDSLHYYALTVHCGTRVYEIDVLSTELYACLLAMLIRLLVVCWLLIDSLMSLWERGMCQ